MTIGAARRCTIAAVSCALAWLLLRPFVADALRARGDEFLRSGDPRGAQRYYLRAIAVDPACEGAVEQYTFSSLEIRSPENLSMGIRIADAYLALHPANVPVRIDRALALFAARSSRAARELGSIGESLHDARFVQLGAIAARRTGDAQR